MSFEDIIKEIETVKSRINNHPAYYSKVHDRARNWLIRESNRHSLAIEDIKVFNSGNHSKKKKKKNKKKKSRI